MKLVASADFYTQKIRDIAEYELRMCEKKENMTDDERVEQAKQHKDNMEQMKKQATELAKTLMIKPRRVSQIKFHIASQKAQAIAARFGLDMCAEVSTRCGFIHFFTDDFVSEDMWGDRREMHQLLNLMRWADSVSIQEADEERRGQIHIELVFRFCKLLGKDMKRYKYLEQLLS